jgi:hypothetical protein
VITRRAALAGAAALALRPATALGADRVAATLLALYVAEQHAALAYRTAGGELARIGEQEDDHALALAAQLGGLARPQPDAPTDPAVLRGSAAKVAAGGEVVAAAIALERELLDAYRKAIPVFKEPEMRRSAATIMASHGQHLSVLYERSGRDPIVSGR